MKIQCTSCGAQYELDDSRIPPGGLTMKCSRCQGTFSVSSPGGGGAPPRAAAGANRFYLRRPSGKVFGPFLEQAIASMLEQQKLTGEEQVSPDGSSWMSMAQVPSLAAFASGGADAELPAPKGASPPGDWELPAPKGAIVPPAPPPAPAASGGGGFDLGELDLGVDDAPLPAPRGADLDLADLPAPRGSAPPHAPPPPAGGPFAPQPPAAPGGVLSDFDDLPMPKGGIADLPAPKGAVPPPAAGSSMSDFADLPAPVGDIADLPAPKGHPAAARPVATGMDYGQLDFGDDSPDLADLPAPKGAASPMGDFADLPAPKGPVADLPRAVTGMEYGQLDFGDDGPDLADLPQPAGPSVGLELDTDFDLPAPKEAAAPDTELPDLMAPKGQVAVDDGIDVVAPKPPRGGGPATVAPPVAARDALQVHEPQAHAGVFDQALDEELPGVVERPSQLKRRLVVVGGALGGLILVVGIVLGLATDFGFFGINLLSGSYTKAQQAATLLKSARRALLEDTFKGYQQAATESEMAASKTGDDPEPKALRAQALAAIPFRFGGYLAMVTQANDLVGQLAAKEETVPAQVIKAKGVVALARGQAQEALGLLQPVSQQEPQDAQAAIYLGWTYLALAKPTPALAAFQQALKAEPRHAAALFGSAQAFDLLNQPDKALASIEKTLQASPRHPGALLLKTSILLAQKKLDQVEAALKLATSARDRAARPEIGRIHAATGKLALLQGNNEAAKQEFDSAIKIDPKNVDALIGRGQIAFSARVYAEALTFFKQADALTPKQITAAVMVARTLLAQGNAPEAQKKLVQIKGIAPNAPEVLFLLGRVEANVSNLDAAAKYFNEALKKDPTYFLPYLHLSRLYVTREDLPGALKVLARANAKIPRSALVRNAEGEALMAFRQFSRAQAKFTEALKLDANLNSALFNLGRCLMADDKLDQALQQFSELSKKDPSFPELNQERGNLYVRRKEYPEAAAAFDLAIKEESPSTRLLLDAAKGYTLAGQYDKALQQTGRVLKEHAFHTEARAIQAKTFLAKGDKDEALLQIRQAVQREKNAENLVILGEIYDARGQTLDAIDAFRDALKLDKSLVQVRLDRARLLIKAGSLRKGIKQLTQVLKERPNLAEAHLYLGLAHVESGKETKALAAFRAALAIDKTMGYAHFKVGQILFDRRNLGAAATALKSALAQAKEEDSWRSEALYLLGSSAATLKNKKLAIESFQAYLKDAPDGSALIPEVKKQLRELGVSLDKPEDD